MKTKLMLTVVLVATGALATGCTPAKDVKSGIVGTYKGFIFNEEEKYPAVTKIKLDGEKLIGSYEMDIGHTIEGELSEFVIVDDERVECKWVDHASRTGELRMKFSPDLSSFEGVWNDEGIDDGSRWIGKK